LVISLRPQRPAATMPAGAIIDKAATVLPLLLFAMPVTLTAALFTLALGEHGLTAGHALMTQRPRLALSFALALVIAALAAVVLVDGARRLPRPKWWPAAGSAGVIRVCAGLTVLLSAALLLRLGAERGEWAILAIATLAGAALHWLGKSPASLIVGLTIGEVMRPALAPALNAGVSDARSGLFVGLAAITLLVALTWPWLMRVRRATVG
jgi:TctA family transporter